MMLLDFLFPKKCVGCGEFGRYLCVDCERFLLKNDQLICPVCRVSSFDGATHKKCESRYGLDGFFCFWQYKGLVKKLIKNLKYRLVRIEAEEIVDLMINNLRKDAKPVVSCHSERIPVSTGRVEESSTNVGSCIRRRPFVDTQDARSLRLLTFLKFLLTKPIVIPVPLHKFRENWRGFNQAALLAKEFAGRFNLKFSDKILERIKESRFQVELNGIAREKNVKGIFGLSPFIVRVERSGVENLRLDTSRRIPRQGSEFTRRVNLLKRRNFLLIDDIWTTGSTLRECGKALKKAGAEKVWALTLAR